MSSPWKLEPNRRAHAPSPGDESPGYAHEVRSSGLDQPRQGLRTCSPAVQCRGDVDEWDLLRAAPDYDLEEMSTVTLAQPWPPRSAESLLPAAGSAHASRAADPEWDDTPPHLCPEPVAGAGTECWPEVQGVASMAAELCHPPAGERTAPEVGPTDLLDVALQAGARAGLIGDQDAGAGPAFDPQSTAGELRSEKSDLLNVALAAGERAGLMNGWDGGAR